jgi:putative SOS response-associated peptidase YedK
MCGRYTLTHASQIVTRFRTLPLVFEQIDRYNVAPTQTMPVILEDRDQRVIDLMTWGLRPSWSKDTNFHPINARAEGIEDKPTFRGPFKYRRCLIPASGFYEWKVIDGKNIPYYIRRRDQQLFAFAGIWESSHLPETHAEIHSYAIITTQPNALMAPIHNRMPVILPHKDEAAWLNHELDGETAVLRSYLTSYPADELEAFPVSAAVNNARTDQADLIGPLNSA